MAFFNLERQYLMLLVFILFDYGIVELQASHHVLMNLQSTNQPYRTGYHFQPLKNFINDPNGPMLYKGIYHLFYQYNPTGDGVSCCTRVWGHSTSTDLAIPRSIWLHPNGKQLMQWPVSEIEILRENPINFPIKEIKAGSLFKVSGITAAQGDVEISFNISNLDNAEKFESNWTDPQSLCNQYGPSVRDGLGPFGLLTLASKGLEEYTAVFFRIFKANNNPIVLMCSDQSRSSLNPTPEKIMYGTFLDMDLAQDDLSLRILIDHSVVESFGGKGKSVITARVYPTLATYKNAHLYVFNNGTRNVEINGLNAWSMNKARVA